MQRCCFAPSAELVSASDHWGNQLQCLDFVRDRLHRTDARGHGAASRRLRRTDAAIAAVPTATEPDVSVVTVKPQPRAIVRELPGRIAPTRVAEVRPRVSGIVVERLFHQGSEVKAGDPLYQIDPRPFEVEVQATEAALAQGQSRASSRRIAAGAPHQRR